MHAFVSSYDQCASLTWAQPISDQCSPTGLSKAGGVSTVPWCEPQKLKNHWDLSIRVGDDLGFQAHLCVIDRLKYYGHGYALEALGIRLNLG